ncbi:hypothetical protein [Subtercola endophyticus]|uniref:hypothetical protein n=1 Tax=Subtercola endophyticus TaxID=2895559 RepID=UPI001E497649|nr:hypothetical protein [Subtercola endophyticus]UFS59463.1 hypothetical protein LQ955_01290 [Subtercola endophyticus]
MNFTDPNFIGLVVAVIGVGGFGAFIRDIVDGLLKLRGGMSARETKRKVDIIQQRDEALARADSEADFRGQMTEYAQALRVQLVSLGVPIDSLMPWPQRKEPSPSSKLREQNPN